MARSGAARRHGRVAAWWVVLSLVCAMGLWGAGGARGQDEQPSTPPSAPGAATDGAPEGAEADPYEGRVVSGIEIEGLKRVQEQFVRNQIRTSVGRPLNWETVKSDLRRLERIGEFQLVQADVVVRPDGTVTVVYKLEEAPIVRDVVVVGNRQITDEDISREVNQRVSLIPGVPIDEYRIGQAQRAIEDLYRSKGFYQVEVTVDQSELADQGIVIFRVREGERTQVTAVRFVGNGSIPAKQIKPALHTKAKVLFFNAPLDNDTLDADVAAIVELYRNRGFLDVRASREITLSPNSREAIVTFVIDEGPQYALRQVLVQGPDGSPASESLHVFSADQIKALIPMKPGDVYEESVASASEKAVRDAYEKIGYVDVAVQREDLRAIDVARVDMRLRIREGQRWRTGLVTVQGNDLTQQKVIRRDVDMSPGDWLDGTAVATSERRLASSGLFEVNPAVGNPPKITIQPPDPDNGDYRDVLVQIEETNTGSLAFGAAVDSDAGIVGTISLTQRNFDIADVPDSWSELFKGRAFRGAGQTFNLAIQPGNEVSTYTLTFTEPSLFESAYAMSSTTFYRTRVYSEYDEERYGTFLRFGRRFGTRWTGGFNFRLENISLSNIENNAPDDVFEVEDPHTLTAMGFDLARTTVDNRFKPTKGTRTEFSVLQYGLIGGDFDFTKLSFGHSVFMAIDEDDFGRKTTLELKGRVGWIPQEGEAPVYERYYLGGRDFRGFDFRGIGPIGINHKSGKPGNDHVGGDFSFFVGAQIEKPIWQEMVAFVVFIDTGTLNDSVSLADYRVAVGAGVRLYLPQFGQAPLAFDFAFPIVQESTDDSQLFSFAIDLPF